MSSETISLVLRGRVDGRVRTYLLGSGTSLVGRHPRCGVVLGVSGVSKRHALLEVELDRIWVEDLGSKNGTFVADQPVEEAAVKVGDRLRFGPVELEVEVLDGDELAIDLGAVVDDLPPFALGGSAVSMTATGTLATMAGTGAEGGSAVRGLVLPAGWIPGVSEVMGRLLRRLARVATSHLPVLIVGETGVGKEGIARALHASSARSAAPFVAVNCAAIPGDLLEAELFGVEAGAATGVAGRPGRFAEADGGTLFLDELAEMPLALQAKLLRTIQEGEVLPVGGAQRSIDVRLVAATNAGLSRMVKEGEFRSDLYYRLAGCVLEIPSLDRRPEDIPSLIEAFLRRAVSERGARVRGITRSALRLLQERSWPGNVRELEHAVERLVFLADDSEVIDTPTVREIVGGQRRGRPPLPTLQLEALERLAVEEALARSEGHQTKAAELLGISRTALYRRLVKFGLGEMAAESVRAEPETA